MIDALDRQKLKEIRIKEIEKERKRKIAKMKQQQKEKDKMLKIQFCQRAKAEQKKHRSLMLAGYTVSRSNYMNEKDRNLTKLVNQHCY
ncbi:MAG: hypothetical protein IIA06_02000 [Proteobacteria bacterium]|nr:hypothetical protein [Pseudomonadota bacterium]